MDIRKIVSTHPELQKMKAAHLDFLVQNASIHEFSSGELLIREGEEATSAYILLDGRVRLEIFSQNHGTKVLQTLVSGDLIGFSCFVEPYIWKFDARASESAKVLCIDGSALRQHCEKDYEFGYYMYYWVLKIVSSRLQMARFQLMDIYAAEREQ